MSKAKAFPFARARRITGEEVLRFRKAIEAKTGKKRRLRRGRAPKAPTAQYRPIRLHP